jgi:hypothetical protein
MSSLSAYFDELGNEFGGGWNRFWYTPASPAPLGIVRIAAGLLTVAFFVSWIPDLATLLSANGRLSPDMVRELLESENRHRFHQSPLFAIDTTGGMWAYTAVAVGIALLFAVGAFTRITAALTLLMVLTFVHRAPLLTSPFETVLVLLLLYLAIAPSGATHSIDAWLARRRGEQRPRPSWLANVGLRLMQVHLAMFLLLVACSAMAYPAWWNGTAVWSLQAQTLSRPLDLSAIRETPKLVNAWTHLFVLANLLFPVLVWYRLVRPLVLAFAAIMWVNMIPVSGQVLYVLAVLAAMTSFLGPRVASESPPEKPGRTAA